MKVIIYQKKAMKMSIIYDNIVEAHYLFGDPYLDWLCCNYSLTEKITEVIVYSKLYDTCIKKTHSVM